MRLFKKILLVCVITVISFVSMGFTHSGGAVLNSHVTDFDMYRDIDDEHLGGCDCGECGGYRRGGYTLNDIRQMLHAGQEFSYYKRVHMPYYGVITYELPLTLDMLPSPGKDTLSTGPRFNYNYTRIRHSGRHNRESIVIVLMGDGFTATQQGIFVDRAREAIDVMLDTHPFSLFRSLFTVYAVQTISPQTWVSTPGNTINRFQSYRPRADRINMPMSGRVQVREVAYFYAGGRQYLDMIHVIANTSLFGGSAFREHNYLASQALGISLTTIHTNNWGWHRTFMHEFGHSFGNLADERSDINSGREAPNMTAAANRSNPRWNHWRGHANIPQYRHITDYYGVRWYVPMGRTTNWLGITNGGCLMSWAHSSIHYFCAVCRAELTRRLAELAGRPFYGKRPDGYVPKDSVVTIPADQRDILPYAFNGNTNITGLVITTPNPLTIGRYAFLGATSLRTIKFTSAFNPPSAVASSFAGLRLADITIIVPTGMLQRFRSSTFWSVFNIIEQEGSTIWAQPDFTGPNLAGHGQITQSGHAPGRPGWGAFDGWIGQVSVGNAAGFPAAQWTK
ncbi:MAG: M64 family metallo-endopeptidase, partial [Firmicutes bacterium]|nr:M64 family metallo-endopeptidase [Bacillota bacterium]